MVFSYNCMIFTYTMKTLEVLFPQARRIIIRLLFTGTDTSLYMREIVRLSGLAVGTMQTELAKLRDVGLLEEWRDGNRLYFRANPKHPFYPELKAMAKKAAEDDQTGPEQAGVPVLGSEDPSDLDQHGGSIPESWAIQSEDVLNLGGF